MRTLSYFLATSLDGFLARPDGGIDWLFSDQDYGFKDFFAGIDTVVMGRQTYELSLTFAEYPYPGRECFVFSRTLAAIEHGGVVNGPVPDFVRSLKARRGGGI